jgi:hypothetical protein
MLRTLAWCYLVFYLVLTVFDVRDSLQRKWPVWQLGLDLALEVVAMVGMLLWLTESAPESVRAAWRFVTPLLVAGFVTISVLEVRFLERTPEPDLSPRANAVVVNLGLAGGILTVIPILCVNWLLAYGRLPWSAE